MVAEGSCSRYLQVQRTKQNAAYRSTFQTHDFRQFNLRKSFYFRNVHLTWTYLNCSMKVLQRLFLFRTRNKVLTLKFPKMGCAGWAKWYILWALVGTCGE